MSRSDNRARAAILAEALARRGWKVTGYYEDKSDSMTDYYAPASWGGEATRDGFTIVAADSYKSKLEIPRGKGWALYKDGVRVACGNLPGKYSSDTYGHTGVARAEAVAEIIDAKIGAPSPWNKVAGGLGRFTRLDAATDRLRRIRYFAEGNTWMQTPPTAQELADRAAAEKFVARRGKISYADRGDALTWATRRIDDKLTAILRGLYPPRTPTETWGCIPLKEKPAVKIVAEADSEGFGRSLRVLM